MRKRKGLAIVLVFVLVLSLAACGSSNGKTSGEQGTSKEKKELTVAIWDTYQEPGLKKIMDKFTKETGIKVTIEVTPWDQYWTMLEAGATGGSLPDVFWMHSNFASQYIEYDMLLDLSDNIKKSDKIDLKNYPEDISKIYQSDSGNQFAIPKDIDTVALWYNKTHFDEAGLAYPDDTWTWDTFTQAAAKLTTTEHYGFSGRSQNQQAGYYNAIYSYGGNIIDETHTKSGWNLPKTVEAMKMYAGLVLDGYTPSPETMIENEDYALLESGKVSMATQGSWMVGELCGNDYIKENCDIAILPKATDGTRVSIYNGLGWAADKATESPESAWALIEYLGSKEAQFEQAELAITMSAYKGTSDAWINGQPDFNLQAYIDMLDETLIIRPYSKTTAKWEDMSIEQIGKAYKGTITVEEACKTIAEEMDAILAEEK